MTNGVVPNPIPRHVTRFCLSVRNRADGFYANHHTGGLDWFNNTACRNNVNYNMLCNLDAKSSTNDVAGFNHVMKTNLGYKGGTEVSNLGPTNDTSFDYFTPSVTVATNDFMTLDESLLTAPREANGDLPYIAFAQLVSTSDLIDKGTNVGFAFSGTAPDLGAFEYAIKPPPTLTMSRPGAELIFAGSGGPAGGRKYRVGSTNLALPLSQWSRVVTNKFDLAGNYSMTNAIPVGMAQRFYRLGLP